MAKVTSIKIDESGLRAEVGLVSDDGVPHTARVMTQAGLNLMLELFGLPKTIPEK